MDINSPLPAHKFNLDSTIKQIVLVTAMPGSLSGYMYAYQKNEQSSFEQKFDIIPVVIGRDGMTSDKHEGDDKSPLGLHKIGYAFGTEKKPEYVSLPYKEITDADKFIDDPTSPDYNTWVHGDTTAKSFEKMQRDDALYDLGLVIEYNMHPVIPGKGSAIFMHIWKNNIRGTEGCVAMHKNNLEKLLKWLKPESNPHIYILES